MRTRYVAGLLGIAVALGMAIDLSVSVGGGTAPEFVRTDHTTAACAAPTPAPRCRRPACSPADPAAQRRFRRRCRPGRPPHPREASTPGRAPVAATSTSAGRR
ncbi:hypothetical protein [Dactylosporangium sp. NPDC049140]|uniref:hypothetical protein n=1 Tax=Dactylosporangium sp. NPDC049140 TaxID=3155647 RepID=UPI0033C6C023